MKLVKISTLILFLLLLGSKAYTQDYQMIFWYPGEAGSTIDAQTTLDAFFDYINKKIAPDKISGKYFNTVEDGLKFIKGAKPVVGIISFAAFEINKAKIPNAKVLLNTLPLPAGKPTEQYTIVGKVNNMNPSALFSKQPLTKDFVQKYIWNNPNLFITIVPNILPVLKEVATGEKAGGIILQPMEYTTLKSMSQTWTKQLTVLRTSEPIPSAPLVTFGDSTLPFIQRLKDVLLKIGQDPTAAGIIETLRFKGFATP